MSTRRIWNISNMSFAVTPLTLTNSFTSFFSVRVAGYIVCYVDHCLSVCTFSFGHCIVCFWLPVWYLQPFLIFIELRNKTKVCFGCANSEFWWCTHFEFKSSHFETWTLPVSMGQKNKSQINLKEIIER
jgi:hypothetical protein